ncbi:hypothetical protein [Azospirillum sp. ST 5-10]|uniref:hypothetical protein n=1 Tax=unclassified Azospirillum TaxID=2630922 RepID=UPI003F49F883
MPLRPLPVDLFDDRNQLRPPWPARIRARLDACGAEPFEARCDRLARAVGAPDAVALWALLMWNASVAPDLAVRLRAWVQRGMPLADPVPPQPGRRAAARTPPAVPPL